MSEAIESIEAHILDTRHDLGEHLQALETKVKSLTDWRNYAQLKPLVVVALVIVTVFLFKTTKTTRKQKAWSRSS